MSEQRYIFGNEKDKEELNRLRLQEVTIDPVTIRRFEMLGVAEGWKCLEVGAGSGSMAEWLAKHVEQKGKVVATDINTRFLKLLNIPNLEVRQHDILKDVLEINYYDITHCRAVLQHLKEPEKALKQMINALKPGGWLLIEEIDRGSMLALDVINPSHALFNSTFRVLYDAVVKRGTNSFIGRQTRSLVDKLGLTNVDSEGICRIIRGGETQAISYATTLQSEAIKPFISAGVITEEQHQNILRLLQDPSFYYWGGTMFGAWGQKPAK